VELWNFQVLAVPELGNAAGKAAAPADFVILSMHRKALLSVRIGIRFYTHTIFGLSTN
jgi:hypothetical protein